MRWAEIAAWSGRPLTASADFDDIAVRPDGTRWIDERVDRQAPIVGELDEESLNAVIELVTRQDSSSGEMWALVWEGEMPEGGMAEEAVGGYPSVDFGDEDERYFLVEAAVEVGAPAERVVRADVWWPDNRTWFVRTDHEGYDTHIEGSQALVESILSSGTLEVLLLR